MWFLPSGYNAGGAVRVSRYKYDRSQKFSTVQDFDCGQMRCLSRPSPSRASGCPGATTITNLSQVQDHPDRYREQKP